MLHGDVVACVGRQLLETLVERVSVGGSFWEDLWHQASMPRAYAMTIRITGVSNTGGWCVVLAAVP